MQDAKKWANTDLSKADAEAPVPKVPEGITSAASFACLETLGVLPPLDEGWLPRSMGSENTSEPVWWANVGDPQWIYNGVEDKYFHLPTKSLWEKRSLQSQDPKAPPYTYHRMDAVHLQALRHFATSVDTNLVPMVFQAWVRVLEKERRLSKDPTKRDPSKSVAGRDLQAVGQTRSGDLQVGGGVRLDPPLLLGATSPSSAQFEKVPEPPPLEAMPETAVEAKGNLQGKEAPTPVSKRARKKSFCFCVFARFDRSEGEEADHLEALPSTSEPGKHPASDRTVSTSAGSSPALQGRKDALAGAKGSDLTDTAATDMAALSPNQAPKAKAVSETAELHMRRLEQFLTEVKKNPQRLVSHVEKRRLDKTGMAFLLLS